MAQKPGKITGKRVAELLTRAGAPARQTGHMSFEKAAETMEMLRDMRINPAPEAVALAHVLNRAKRARDELSRLLPAVTDRMRGRQQLMAAILMDADAGARKHSEKILVLIKLQELLAAAEPALTPQRMALFDRRRTVQIVWELYRYIVGDAGRSVNSPAVRFVALALAAMGYGVIQPASVAQSLRRAKVGATNE